MNVIDRALSLIAPHNCIECGAEGAVLCRECAEEKLVLLPTGICFLCGKLSANYKTCQKCSTRYTPQHVWVVANYDEVAKRLVVAYKFDHMRDAARIMAQYMDETLPYFADEPLFTFVPTVSKHIRERGFDQAAMLAKELARIRKWHYATLLIRQNNGQQHGATKSTRQTQVKDAFRIKETSLLKGKHILLLDDVTTTGSTLVECSKILKKAGAADVNAIVFARTPEKS